MTETETAPDPAPRVELVGQRTLWAHYDGQTLALSFPAAEALARDLRETVYTAAPTMTRVLGLPHTDNDAHLRVLDPEQAAAALAEGWDVEHGLACPHPDCTHVAWDDDDDDGVLIVDEDERWSGATYRRDQVPELAPYDPANPTRRRQPTGRQILAETVHTGGADTDYQGLGYRCPTCHRPVTLPAGIEESWS